MKLTHVEFRENVRLPGKLGMQSYAKAEKGLSIELDATNGTIWLTVGDDETGVPIVVARNYKRTSSIAKGAVERRDPFPQPRASSRVDA
jgi:hypothetical protein